MGHADRDRHLVDARNGERLLHALAEAVVLDLEAVLLLDPVHGREVDRSVARRSVDLALDVLHEPVHRGPRVGDIGAKMGLLRAAGDVARDAGDDVALATLSDGGVDHRVDAWLYADLARGQLVVLVADRDLDRALEA